MVRSARSHTFTLTVICVALAWPRLSGAASQLVTVEGKNDPVVDVQAVQKAIDQGGTIVLKGRFDFGEQGSVTITKDVNVLGEMDEPGSPRTMVRGGYGTFHSFPTAQMPPPGPKIAIKNIHFDGARWTPVRLAYASRVTITGNRITGVRPHPAPERPEFGLQHGILVGTLLPFDKRGRYEPGAVVGTVAIADNDIELSTEAPTETMAQGIFVFGTTGINARIARNTIANSARNAIEVLDNYLGNDGNGFIVIQDNRIVTATEGFARPTPRTPNGIVVGYLRDRSAAVDPKRLIRHLVLHNSIVARGATSTGINVLTNGALVRNNNVVTEGTTARAISVSGSNTYIGRNQIEGAGEFGIWLGSRASGNEVDGNDFEQFKAVVADVMLNKGASDNVVTGTSGSVSDPGAGNQIRRLKRLSK